MVHTKTFLETIPSFWFSTFIMGTKKKKQSKRKYTLSRLSILIVNFFLILVYIRRNYFSGLRYHLFIYKKLTLFLTATYTSRHYWKRKHYWKTYIQRIKNICGVFYTIGINNKIHFLLVLLEKLWYMSLNINI